MSPFPISGGPGPRDQGPPPVAAPSDLPTPPGPPPPGQGSPDQANSGLQAVMGQLRDLGQQAQQIGTTIPAFADEVQQLQAVIRRMIIKAGQVAPTQTDSGSAVPMG